MLENIRQTSNYLKSKIEEIPNTAIILGTGLGELVHEIDNKQIIPYTEIPNFPVSTVRGHSGNLIVGTLGGKRKYWLCKDVFITTEGTLQRSLSLSFKL